MDCYKQIIDTSHKIKQKFFPTSSTYVSTTVRLHHLDSNRMLREKAR